MNDKTEAENKCVNIQKQTTRAVQFKYCKRTQEDNVKILTR